MPAYTNAFELEFGSSEHLTQRAAATTAHEAGIEAVRELHGLAAGRGGARAAEAAVVAFVVAAASGALATLIEEPITPAVMEQVEKVRRPPLYSPA